MIKSALDLGHSGEGLFQDLVRDSQFAGSYDSVKRFVRQLERTRPLPFRRMEVEPGAELQVDFGLGASVEVDSCRRRCPPRLQAVLIHSHDGYAGAGIKFTENNALHRWEFPSLAARVWVWRLLHSISAGCPPFPPRVPSEQCA